MSDSSYIRKESHHHLLSERSSTAQTLFSVEDLAAYRQLGRAHARLYTPSVDTVESHETEGQVRVVLPQEAPTLPRSKPSKNPDFLGILAETFAKIYRVSAESLVSQAKDYQGLETSQEQMSQLVLESSLKSIQDQKNDIETRAALEESQERAAKVNKIFTWVSRITMGIVGVAGIVALVANIFVDPASTPVALTLALRIGQGMAAVVIASPMLAKGTIAVKDTVPILTNLADKEAAIGASSANMQLSTMLYRSFWQQVKQESGLLEEGGDLTGKVVETFGDILSSYRSINQGLASAV